MHCTSTQAINISPRWGEIQTYCTSKLNSRESHQAHFPGVVSVTTSRPGFFASILFDFPIVDCSFALRLTALLPLVCFARIATCHSPIPCRMVRPCPFLRHRSVAHRAECPGLMSRSFIDVNDESREHQKRHAIMNYITDANKPAWHHFTDPQQQSAEQKQDAT